jgi:hypothetical protein
MPVHYDHTRSPADGFVIVFSSTTAANKNGIRYRWPFRLLQWRVPNLLSHAFKWEDDDKLLIMKYVERSCCVLV